MRTDKEFDGIFDQRFAVFVIHVGNEPICDSSGAADAPSCRPQTDYKNRSGLLNDALIAFRTVMSVRNSRVEYGLRDLELQSKQVISQSKIDTNIDPRGSTEEELNEKEERGDGALHIRPLFDCSDAGSRHHRAAGC
jgi:hypothetical protein